jgi:hypothetical protein
MKCAMELTAIAMVRAKEIADEQALRRQKELEEQRKYTQAVCEELGTELEELANKGQKPQVFFKCSKWHWILRSTRKDYADSRLSYRVVDNTRLDIEYLKQWFESYCFEVKMQPMNYWMYGYGECKGYDVTIVPKPQCFE